MKKWILFLVVPLIVLWGLELLSAIIFGGFLKIEPRSFWSGVVEFIIYFLGGVAFLHCAPKKTPVLAYVFAVIYSVIGFSLGIYTDGNIIKIMGETVVQKFSFLQEFARISGLFLGVWGAVQSEKEEKLSTIKNS